MFINIEFQKKTTIKKPTGLIITGWLTIEGKNPIYEISICLAGFSLASSFLGIEIFRMPFSYLASIFSEFTISGNVKERWNEV